MVIYEDDIFKDIRHVIYLNIHVVDVVGVVAVVVVVFLNLNVFDFCIISSVSYCRVTPNIIFSYEPLRTLIPKKDNFRCVIGFNEIRVPLSVTVIARTGVGLIVMTLNPSRWMCNTTKNSQTTHFGI